MIDLVLVKPGGRLKLFSGLAPFSSGCAPPLDIGLITSFIRSNGYTVRIIDADAEFLTPLQTTKKIIEYDPFLVGIFAHTIKMVHAANTIKELRKIAPHIKILLGGRHPSALPEKTLLGEKVDFVCQGEAFYPLLQLLKLLKSKKRTTDYPIRGICYKKGGKMILNPPDQLIHNLDELPFISWDLLPMDKYRAHNWHCFDNLKERQAYAIIYTSLGCPFNCSYCCVNATYGRPNIRFRSPQKVIDELDYLVENYKVRNIRIVDDIFTFNQQHALDICNLIIQRRHNLNIWCYARIDTVSEALLIKMKQAGIRWVAYGFEAIHEKVREGVLKHIGPDKIKKGIEVTKKVGINIIANFIFGLPDDNITTMQDTLNMAKEYNFEYVNFYVAMAWPGSKLYEDAMKRGTRLPKNWDGYAQLSYETLPLPTKYLSASEVLHFRDNAFVEYFSNPKYLEVIQHKFGPMVVEHVRDMLAYKIQRKFI